MLAEMVSTQPLYGVSRDRVGLEPVQTFLSLHPFADLYPDRVMHEPIENFRPLIPQIPEGNPTAGEHILKHVEELGLKTALVAAAFKGAERLNFSRRHFLGISTYAAALAAALGTSGALQVMSAEASQEYFAALRAKYEPRGFVFDTDDPAPWTSTTFLTMNPALASQYEYVLGTGDGHNVAAVYDAIAGAHGFPTGVFGQAQDLRQQNIDFFNRPDHYDPNAVNWLGFCHGLAAFQFNQPKPPTQSYVLDGHTITPEVAVGVGVLNHSGDVPDLYAEDSAGIASTLGYRRSLGKRAVVNIPYAYNTAGQLYRLPGGDMVTWARVVFGFGPNSVITTGFTNDDRLVELPISAIKDILVPVHYDGGQPLSPAHQQIINQWQISGWRFNQMRDSMANAISYGQALPAHP